MPGLSLYVLLRLVAFLAVTLINYAATTDAWGQFIVLYILFSSLTL